MGPGVFGHDVEEARDITSVERVDYDLPIFVHLPVAEAGNFLDVAGDVFDVGLIHNIDALVGRCDGGNGR